MLAIPIKNNPLLLGLSFVFLLVGSIFGSQANASSYQFTEQLTDSNTTTPTHTLTATFNGIANGNIISNLSNIEVYLDGVKFTTDATGSLYGGSVVDSAGNQYVAGGAQVSIDGLQNNFFFSYTATPSLSASNLVNAVDSYAGTKYNGNPLSAGAVFLSDGTQITNLYPLYLDPTTNTYSPSLNSIAAPLGWQVTAVPVPGAVWLFGSTLVGFGLLGKRRRAA